METSKTFFSQSLKENKNHPRLNSFITQLVIDIASKRLQRLKDPSHVQKRVKELFDTFHEVLINENLASQDNLISMIDGLVQAASANEKALLFNRIYEKEQLEKWILEQQNDIKNLIRLTYETLENEIKNDNTTVQLALKDSKLRGIEMLGILKETTQEALLTTIEKGEDIEDTTVEITKDISYQAINQGDFTKQRFLDIAHTIIQVCVEIADTDQAFAKKLLYGGVHGTKEGIVKAVEKFKNDLKYSPEEVESLLRRDLNETKKELLKIDEEYIKMLRNCAKNSNGISKDILEKILDEELDSSFAKLQRITYEAREVISDRLDEIKKNASYFEREFKQKAAIRMEELKKEMSELEKKAGERMDSFKNNPHTKEARKLGQRAWEVAKGMANGAIKGAKSAMKKDDE